jgi:hypothetical protein
MTEPPTVPAAGLFYGGDLAYVHDAAFGHLARGGARMLLRLLGRTGIRTGLVIDLGAGSASPHAPSPTPAMRCWASSCPPTWSSSPASIRP